MLILKLSLAAVAVLAMAPASQPATSAGGQRVAVVFEGGHETVGEDRGRPVKLIAAALGVPDQVFRDAFKKVKPAPAGEKPDPDQVRKNKQALMDALSKYDVTNERLDEVSNYYRYRREDASLWKHRDAKAEAVVKDGKVVEVKVLDAGAGYSSTPTAKVEGITAPLSVELSFGKDLHTNGSVRAITAGETKPETH